jgi:hypothetical protein
MPNRIQERGVGGCDLGYTVYHCAVLSGEDQQVQMWAVWKILLPQIHRKPEFRTVE